MWQGWNIGSRLHENLTFRRDLDSQQDEFEYKDQECHLRESYDHLSREDQIEYYYGRENPPVERRKLNLWYCLVP